MTLGNEWPRRDAQDWEQRGACRDHPEIDWAPDLRYADRLAAKVERAAEVCRTCPVFAQCEEAGRNTPAGDSGIYAGRLSRDLKPRRRAQEPIPHGTNSGYRMHYRRGIPMCEPCRLAYRQYETERRRIDPNRRKDRHLGDTTEHQEQTA